MSNTYRIGHQYSDAGRIGAGEYEPSRGSWTLTGPVGAKGYLSYVTARDAVSYARWDARDSGGNIEVFGQLLSFRGLAPLEAFSWTD